MRDIYILKSRKKIHYLMTPLKISEKDVFDFAIQAHKEQGDLYSGQPYSVHLEDIRQRVARKDYVLPPQYDSDHELSEFIHLTAQRLSYTHDVIEDTKYEMVDLLVFGRTLAKATDLISDVTIGVNRKERKKLTYEKHSKLDHLKRIEDMLVLIVKPVDRISNWESAIQKSDKKKIKMYRKEYPDFRKAVYRKGLYDKAWEKLEQLYKLSQPKSVK